MPVVGYGSRHAAQSRSGARDDAPTEVYQWATSCVEFSVKMGLMRNRGGDIMDSAGITGPEMRGQPARKPSGLCQTTSPWG